MNIYFNVIIILFFVHYGFGIENSAGLFSQLFKNVMNALVASGANGPQKYIPYQSEFNGISASVYGALQTITKNDDLHCVPRLLCEAVAGGKPGGSRQINIDKYSLSKLISYLQLDPENASPMLTFGKAVVLGLSNRGDPYSCIINYPKCPKDEQRLLYYLNNHRGGFFRFFDMKLPHQNYQYGQNSYYTQYPSYTYKPNQYYYSRKANSSLFKTNDKYTNTYANKYRHSHISFPEEKRATSVKRIAFPVDKLLGQLRIQTKPTSGADLSTPLRSSETYFVFSNTQRGSKNIKESSFFTHHPNSVIKPAHFVTDRLPSKLYFPDETNENEMRFPEPQKGGSFFPRV